MEQPKEGQIEEQVLNELVRRIVEVAKPERIILFGSAARDQIGPDSDLDLLIVKSDVPHRRRLAQQIQLNLFGLGVPVDIIVVSPEDVEAFGEKVGTVLRPVLEEGKEIYAA